LRHAHDADTLLERHRPILILRLHDPTSPHPPRRRPSRPRGWRVRAARALPSSCRVLGLRRDRRTAAAASARSRL